ncbi:galactose mutarotase [Mariniblastus sp.]|nr:galactose mutarotase [Mariniblastus sp.]
MKIGFCIAAFVIGCLFAVLVRSSSEVAPAEGADTTPTQLAAELDAATVTAPPMTLKVVKHSYGAFEASPVSRYVCSNENGLSFEVIDWGATIVAVNTPDREGRFGNVVLNCEGLEGYQACQSFFGSTIGRFSDRIAYGSFSLDGHQYSLSLNDGKNHLNGGSKGFDKQVWATEEIVDADAVGVRMSMTSPDGDQGYPGACQVSVTYLLNNDDQLSVQFEAQTDAATPINLASQVFWNLNGDATGSVATHQLRIDADQRLVLDNQQIPTGETKSVSETRFDFRQPITIGHFDLVISSPVSLNNPLTLENCFKGFNDNFVLNSQTGVLAHAATLSSPSSGRKVEVWTTQPGLLLDSANLLDGQPSSGGLQKHSGISLRTQHHPDSPNQSEFPSTVIQPGDKYDQKTVYSFSIAD